MLSNSGHLRAAFAPFRVIPAAALVLAAACGDSAAPPSQSVQPRGAPLEALVHAGGESLRGVVLDETAGLMVFRGIPYAAPPTGANRWKPPAAPLPREGLQTAAEFAAACPQDQGNHDWYRNVAELFGNPPETVGALERIAEDCLYLNVWTSNPDLKAKRPVMVWIHGGSNLNGYAHEPNYLGHSFARNGIVYVSINYRLGPLGFMAHAGLSAESPDGVSGNYGLLDQLAALRWVQQNIAEFGGDPENVTVFGESAGGGNIGTLIASPLASGLFHRAIIQSGGYPVNVALTREIAEQIGSKIAAQLGFESQLSPVEVVDGMRDLDWRDILQGAANADVGRYLAANIDGHLLTEAAIDVFNGGRFNNVDLLIGVNANENYMYLATEVSAEELQRNIAYFGEPYAQRLAEILSAGEADPVRVTLDRLTTAQTFLCSSKFIATSMAGNGAAVYFYYFTRIRPGGDRILAYHGAEIPYTHDTADSWLPADDTDVALTAAMHRYWISFAKTGSPNTDGLPIWPPYTADNDAYMELGDTIAPGSGLENELCAVLNEHRNDTLSTMK